jgi:hypothetical protein
MIGMRGIARVSAAVCYAAAFGVPAWGADEDLKGLTQAGYQAYLLNETRACGLTEDAVLTSLKRTIGERTKIQEIRALYPSIILSVRTTRIGDACVHHVNLELVTLHLIRFDYNGSTFARPVVIWRQDAMTSGNASTAQEQIEALARKLGEIWQMFNAK